MPAGVTLELDASELGVLAADLRRAARADRRRLMAGLAAVGESATRARLTAGGPDPDGRPWPPRHPLSRGRHPLLSHRGGLHDSIEADADESTARWGSNLVYARIHQMGGVVTPRRGGVLAFAGGRDPIFRTRAVIPARPYVGWGGEERREAAAVVERWLDQALGGGRRGAS